MQKKTEKVVAAFLLAGIICLVVFFFLQNSSSYKFQYSKGGVLFASNDAEPAALMRGFNLSDTVFVSPALYEQGAGNNSVLSAFNLVQVVFIGNDKNAVSLWRVFDRNGMLASCRTNNGDVLKDIEVSASGCRKILDDRNNAILLISMPASDKKSKVVFSQNSIEIVPDKTENAAAVSFSFLKAMYDNAELIIKKTNQFTEFVK